MAMLLLVHNPLVCVEFLWESDGYGHSLLG